MRLALLAIVPGCFLTHGDPQCVMTGAETMIMNWESGMLHDTPDGSLVPLVSAPQGGHIMLIGARVMMADRCTVRINAALRDTGNNRVIGLDAREIALADRGDGWAEPADWMALSGLANLPVCPTSAASKPVDGNAFQLEVRLTQSGTVISERTASIVPTCGAGNAYCHNECTKGGL